MKRTIAFVTGAILIIIPAVNGVINGASYTGLILIATAVATHIAIETRTKP